MNKILNMVQKSSNRRHKAGRNPYNIESKAWAHVREHIGNNNIVNIYHLQLVIEETSQC